MKGDKLDMEALRLALDETDRMLVAGLERRMELVREIAAYKRTHGLPVCDAAREEDMRAARAAWVQDGRNAGCVDALTESLLSYSKNEQRRLYNVYLIGMPGAGKSYFARRIAENSPLALMDTDDMAVAMGGMSIAEIFELRGEAGFRTLERGVLMECARRGGCIVATGGGIVSAENVELMRTSGRVAFLDRCLDALLEQDHTGRPLIGSGEDVVRLYEQRHAAYAAAADITLDPDAPGALQTLLACCAE